MLAIAPVPCRPAPLQTDRVTHQQAYVMKRGPARTAPPASVACRRFCVGRLSAGGQPSQPEQALQGGIDAVSRQRECKDGQQAGRQVHNSGRICTRERQGGRHVRTNACLLRDEANNIQATSNGTAGGTAVAAAAQLEAGARAPVNRRAQRCRSSTIPAIEHSCRVDVMASAVQMARRAVRGQPAPRLLLTRVEAAIEKPVTPMKMMPARMGGRQGQG
jgi:hypothetical protein